MESVQRRRRLLKELVRRINNKNWWHVRRDIDRHRKQGTFLSSTFRRAALLGQPITEPYQVSVSSPFVGDEEAIEVQLLKERVRPGVTDMPMQLRWDGRLKKAALKQGYDCIVFMSPKDFEDYRLREKIPLSIDLTIFL